MQEPTQHNRDWLNHGTLERGSIDNTPVPTALTVHQAPLRTRMLQGAGLAAFMTLLRFTSPEDLPSMMETVLMFSSVAVGGGIGGAVYYATDNWRARGGVLKTIANVSSLLAYCLVTGGIVLAFFVAQRAI